MQRYFGVNKNLELSSNDYNHISKVMRMKKEDKVEIVFENYIYLCNIVNIDSKKVYTEVISKTKIIEDSIKVHLIIPLLKEQKMDIIFQKATELGVNEFTPINIERSIIKNTNDNKYKRWNIICKEASEQSKRGKIPKINDIINIQDIKNINADIKLLCTTNEKANNIKKVLQNKISYDKIVVITGPEGGFTNNEEQILLDNGFIPVSFGNQILRAETAPIYIMSILKYEYSR